MFLSVCSLNEGFMGAMRPSFLGETVKSGACLV